MKKLLMFFVVLALITGFSFQVFAQEKDFKNGDNIIHAGLGLGMAGMYYDVSIPPIIVSYDRGLFINEIPLSFGVLAGFAKSTYSEKIFADELTYEFTYTIIALRSAYHFDFGIKNFDPYAGITLGYNIVKFSADFPSGYDLYAALVEDSAVSFFLWGFEVGATYYFTPNIGAYAELGYGVGIFRAGLAYRF